MSTPCAAGCVSTPDAPRQRGLEECSSGRRRSSGVWNVLGAFGAPQDETLAFGAPQDETLVSDMPDSLPVVREAFPKTVRLV